MTCLLYTSTAGVRGTQHKETGLNFSPKISGLYKPGEHINLRASYALGYKAPVSYTHLQISIPPIESKD